MIRNISIRLLGIFLFVLVAGTVVGWLIIEDLAGEEMGFTFLMPGLIISLIIFSIQSALFFLAGRRLFGQLLFLTAGVFSITWFMFCFFAPLLWIDYIKIEFRIFMAVALVFLSVSNILEACRRFNEKWERRVQPVRYIKSGEDMKKNIIDWDELIKSMNLSTEIYIPGVSPGLAAGISVVMVVFMLLGFFLKSIYPIFSAFAWGIPSALTVAYLFQIVGYNAAQAIKVKSLERKFNVKFQSSVDANHRC